MTNTTPEKSYLELTKQDISLSQLPPAPAVLQEMTHLAGVCFNGEQPWDIRVHDPLTYRRILTHGSLGFGESYMDNLWDCIQLDELFYRLLKVDVERYFGGLAKMRLISQVIRQNLFNLQTSKRAHQVGEHHYDTGNDLFEVMLDPTMSYSCGYWAHANSLEQAQLDKLDLICRKLELKLGDKVLDIGCGWGGFAQYATQHYGVEVVGVTISKQQQQLAQQRCKDLPVTIKLQDYRDLQGQFDKIVSIGMFEHVGPKNYRTYFNCVSKLLKHNGLFLLHTIGLDKTSLNIDHWIDKYIFPNGMLPSAEQITKAFNQQLVIEDWHNFGSDYDKTLMAWWQNFERGWPMLSEHYDDRFYRMWKYYLHSCAGFFRCKRGQLWQLVLSKPGREGRYFSLR